MDKRVNNKRPRGKVTKETLLKMINYANQFNSFRVAYDTMVNRNECKAYSYNFYLDRAKGLPEYLAWRNKVNLHEKQVIETIIYYHEKGLSKKDISIKLGVHESKVYKTIRAHDNNVKSVSTEDKAKSIVNWWNNNSFENRFMTKETKQAFELLGLEIPKL